MGENFAKRIDNLSNLRRWFPILLLVTLCPFDEAVVPEVTIEGTPEKVAVVGHEIQLTCHYNSSPVASEVQWLKNDKVISRNDTMENNTRGTITQFNESSTQLTISSSISSDAANYTCLVINDVDNSSVTIAIRVKPDPPHNLQISYTTSRTLTVSWSAGVNGNSEIISYKVNISQDNQTFEDVSCQGSFNDSSCTVPGVVTNVTLKDLHPFTTYFVRVFAVNKIGQSESSEVVNATTDEEVPSAPPSNVTGRSKSSTSIFVQWEQVPASNQNGVILSYTVTYIALPDGSSQTMNVTAPANHTTLSGLNKYTNYSITVFASTSKGGGNQSTPIVVMTDEGKPNAPPSNVTGHNVSSTSIFISWGQVPFPDQNGVILSYTVTYRVLPSGSSQTKNVTAPANQTTLTGLNEYTNYSITVFASTSKGGGNQSTPIVVITDEDKPNAPPSNVTGHNASSTSIIVNWGQVPFLDQNGVILSYTVSYRALPSGSSQTKNVAAAANHTTLTGLNEYTNYSITVFASTSKGSGNQSTPIVVITDEDKPNAPPSNVTGHNASSTSIFVSWGQVPFLDQNGVILSYTVSYRALPSGSSQTKNVAAAANHTTLTGLNEYTNYSITVFASTSKGGGNQSTPIVVITDENKPNASPSNVTGHNASSTSIFVSWKQVPFPDQNGVIVSYTVTYTWLPSGPLQTKTVSAAANQTTLTGLNEYTNYSITVFASTSKGAGNQSTPIVVITDEDKPNAPPSNVTGHNASSTSIFVSWGQVPFLDQNGVIVSYTVTYTGPSGPAEAKKVFPPANHTTLTGLNKYTNYNITVFASTAKGAGNQSTPIVVITDEDKPNAPPSNVTGHNASSTSIFVSWGQVPFPDQNGVIVSYTVTYTGPSGPAETKKVFPPANHTTLTGLNKYTNYNITVFASTSKGAGNQSTPIVVITDEDKPNAPPSNVTGHNASSTSIFVSWGDVPFPDQNGVIVSYTVTYTWLPNGTLQTKTVSAAANQTTLTGLNEYTNYRITVFASTSKGAGNQSTPIVVITDEDIPSAPPANFRGYNTSSTSIFVQWDQVPAADQNGVILNYTIKYIETDSSGSEAFTKKTVVVVAPKRNVTLEKLNKYTIYKITVAASTSKGKGRESESPLQIRTEQDKPSAPPAKVSARNTSSTSIFVQWDQVPPKDQNGVILSYTITYMVLPGESSQTKEVHAPASQTTLTGLNEYTNYRITVFASTSKGAGNQSTPIVVITDEDRPNASPANVSGRAINSTSILVSWREVPFPDQNGVIQSYTVTYRALSNSSEKTKKVTAPANQTTLTDLNKYTNYSITVFASTSKGKGNRSTAIVVITDEDTPSAAPVSLQGHNKSSTSIFVTWGQVPPSEQNGVILNYTVSYKEASNGSAQTVLVTVNEPTNSATLKGLNEYTNYSITVFASTIKGGGIVSAPIIVITDEDKPNAPPSNVNGHNVSSTRISVSWRQVPFLDQNGVILSYTVTYRALPSGSSQTKNVIAPADQTTLAGLNEYTNYSITVFASTSKGGGNQSTPIVVITDEDKPNAPPSNVTGRNESSTSIFVQWNQVPAQDQNGVILSYTVFYRALTDCPTKGRNFTTLKNNFTLLTGLNNYTNYSITVFASTVKGSGNVSSPIIVSTDQDVPSNFPDGLKLNDTTSTSILVQWDKVPHCDKNGIITSYTVRYQAISDRTNHGNETTVLAPLMSANLTDLIINMKYRISVLASTVKGDGPYSSSKVFSTNQSEPGAAPRNVRGKSSRSTTILVWWDEVLVSKQHGEIISYTVFYWKTDGGGEGKEDKTENRKVELIGLQKYTDYTIQVLASTIKGDGPRSRPTIVRTDQDTPDGSPVITGLTALDSTTVMVSWKPVPENLTNGIITRYIIWYLHKDEENKNAKTKKINAPALNATITGLRQKARYSFEIQAATSEGLGPFSGANLTQTEAVPKADPLPTDSIGTATAEIRFDTREYLTNGEKVSYYQVIVVQLKEGQDAGNPADPKYKNVRANYEQKKDGEPYITAEFSRKDVKETFTIGDDKYYSKSGVTESRRKRRETASQKYLNGELEDGTETAAFQRSFDATGFYEDGNLYTFTTSKDPTLAIVLPIVIILMIAVIVVGIFIYRRRRQNLFNGDEDEGMPMNETSRGGKASSKRNRMSDNPNHSPGETIPVEEFEGHVRRLRANGDLLFSQEYSALRPTSNYTWNATLAQENRFKNRYNNIVAYDHSRVKLNPINNAPGSDYINANYLDGYARKRAYIATQGPLPETTDDFWRMVWEQNTKTIVMVTNLEEKGRVKCFQYWPSEGGETHGDIQVQLTETVELSDFTIRKFCLKKSNSRAERMVSQYHYTIWPDHGVPSCATSVLTFVRKASGSNPPDAGPMVVHCSAGVGRTGTFIVVDAMLQRIAAEKTVDVFGYVMSLRCDRNIMVQVEEQYVFIHEVLLEAIHSGYTEVRANDLRSHIKNLMQVNQNSGQSEMEEEFTRLGRGVAAPPSKFQAANMPYNKTKNRYANVLAFDDSRVKLSVITGIEGSDYINASFVDGYMMRRAFIATQAPIPDTIPDFWRMIWEQESSTVVMLSKETESGKVKVHRYWPAKQPANIGNLVVEMTNEMVYDDYTMREIKLTNTKESASRVIRQYHYTGWPDVGSPDSGTGLIDLIGQVQRWQQQSGDTTVTVHCSAGVGRTGVFCSLSIVIERLKSEGVVDVFQTVKQLRAQRPAMVQTKEQYEFIYFALREYLDSFDAYSNFE
ncbi:receptor-type tyrosine-protein phosphatase delta-like isoform X2 [Acropora millepora]|uniref:receptor-type tyrosine-protein phosphatase delta-like isoform X2 n=1 Tax=Acropora millepora TaxID=45264 RepID=UPI001CF4542B|nr:receptor-type tyrosine-protein phosphatase delta-like isoform X2 [Acropora millepora]